MDKGQSPLHALLKQPDPLPVGLVREIARMINSLPDKATIAWRVAERPELPTDDLIALAHSQHDARIMKAIASRTVTTDQLWTLARLAENLASVHVATIAHVITHEHAKTLVADPDNFTGLMFAAAQPDPVRAGVAMRIILDAHPTSPGITRARVGRLADDARQNPALRRALREAILSITNPSTLDAVARIAWKDTDVIEHVLAHSNLRTTPGREGQVRHLERLLAAAQEKPAPTAAIEPTIAMPAAVAGLPDDLHWNAFVTLVAPVTVSFASDVIATATDALRDPIRAVNR